MSYLILSINLYLSTNILKGTTLEEVLCLQSAIDESSEASHLKNPLTKKGVLDSNTSFFEIYLA